MIDTSAEYKTAIDAPTRRITPKVMMDLVDPDLEVLSITGDYESAYSFPDQLTDKDTAYSGLAYASLEASRWILDGSMSIMPDNPLSRTGEQGVIGDALSDGDGLLNDTITMTFTGVDVLQAVTVGCTGLLVDGAPAVLTLKVYSNDTLLHEAIAEPTENVFIFDGFTATLPNKIELTVGSWTLPGRRFRLTELLPGHLEMWGGETVYRLDVLRKVDISNLSIPYSSASLEIDNTSKKFDPMNKDGIFKTLTAGQPVALWLGVEIGGSYEYVPVGIYYQQAEGWTIQNNGMTIKFDLIDIIGMLAGRKFKLSGSQPTTLEGWVSQITGQLGTTFAGHYTIDGDLASMSMVCDPADIENITCGDLLRFICQAASAFPISDSETGYLHIKQLDNLVHDEIDLRQQNSIPGSQANQNIAFLTFDIQGTQYNIPGTEEMSETTATIKNPFVTTLIGADLASRHILPQYGGNTLNLLCRGDMSREPGDMETVEIYPDVYTAARIIEEQLTLDRGIMTNVPLKMLQADGMMLYTDLITITESGTYQMPAGVTEITLVLIGGGDGGTGGPSGAYLGDAYGATGSYGGQGGKVYTIPITINDGQTFTVSIGQGGAGGSGGHFPQGTEPSSVANGQPGGAGGDTTATFGTIYSSASGSRMPHGYVDFITNKAYGVPGSNGRPKMDAPKTGANGTAYTGNGGNGGDGGRDAIIEWIKLTEDPRNSPGFHSLPMVQQMAIIAAWEAEEPYPRTIEWPVNGARGGRGANGLCLIFYSR